MFSLFMGILSRWQKVHNSPSCGWYHCQGRHSVVPIKVHTSHNQKEPSYSEAAGLQELGGSIRARPSPLRSGSWPSGATGWPVYKTGFWMRWTTGLVYKGSSYTHLFLVRLPTPSILPHQQSGEECPVCPFLYLHSHSCW